MHYTVSIRNAIIISCPDSERNDADWWGEMAMKQYGRTREMTNCGGRLRGPN